MAPLSGMRYGRPPPARISPATVSMTSGPRARSAVGAVAHLRAEQPAEEKIAVVGRGRGARHHQHRAQAEPRGHRGHCPAAVRLERAARDQGVGALLQRLADQELELAHLVAGLEQAGQVVALDVQLHSETAGEAIELEDRGGREGQLEPGGRCGHQQSYACSVFRLAAIGAKS